MSNRKFYDTRVKAQKKCELINHVERHYKPSYFRIIIQANNADEAKKATLKVIEDTYGDILKNVIVKITKCSYLKIDGVFSASQILTKNK